MDACSLYESISRKFRAFHGHLWSSSRSRVAVTHRPTTIAAAKVWGEATCEMVSLGSA
jgi:hypothetical protein